MNRRDRVEGVDEHGATSGEMINLVSHAGGHLNKGGAAAFDGCHEAERYFLLHAVLCAKLDW